MTDYDEPEGTMDREAFVQALNDAWADIDKECPEHGLEPPCLACLNEHIQSFYDEDYVPDWQRQGHERP